MKGEYQKIKGKCQKMKGEYQKMKGEYQKCAFPPGKSNSIYWATKFWINAKYVRKCLKQCARSASYASFAVKIDLCSYEMFLCFTSTVLNGFWVAESESVVRFGKSLVDSLKSAFFSNNFHFWLTFFEFSIQNQKLWSHISTSGGRMRSCSLRNRRVQGPKFILLPISRRRQPALIHFDRCERTVQCQIWSVTS